LINAELFRFQDDAFYIWHQGDDIGNMHYLCTIKPHLHSLKQQNISINKHK